MALLSLPMSSLSDVPLANGPLQRIHVFKWLDTLISTFEFAVVARVASSYSRRGSLKAQPIFGLIANCVVSSSNPQELRGVDVCRSNVFKD